MNKNSSTHWVQLFRYIVAGTLTTLLDLLVFLIGYYQFNISRNESVLYAFIAALVFSFIVNRFWTFKDNYKDSEWKISQLLKFVFVASLGLIITLISMKILTDFFSVEPLLAKIITSGIVFVWNFTVNSFWTFAADETEEIVKPLLPENKNFIYDLSIIIPAYNEEKRLPKTLQNAIKYFSSLNILFEIIVVDDGSHDETSTIAKKHLLSSHKIIQLSENKGKGFAVKTGVLEAEGRYILFCDADGATPFHQYKKLREAMLFSEIAIGSRYKNRKTVQKKQPLYRTIISRIINIIAQIFLIEGISDTQCGFKLFRSDVGKQIFSHQKIERFAFDIEFLMLGKRLGFRITEIAVLWYDQPGTKVNGLKDGIRAFQDFLRIKFYMMFGVYEKK